MQINFHKMTIVFFVYIFMVIYKQMRHTFMMNFHILRLNVGIWDSKIIKSTQKI